MLNEHNQFHLKSLQYQLKEEVKNCSGLFLIKFAEY
jgi:hypothetical protein